MKNKKLFAILTLVCFMFTLMPVAAFAATPAVEVSAVNGNYAVQTEGFDAKEKVTVTVKGAATIVFQNQSLNEDGTVVGAAAMLNPFGVSITEVTVEQGSLSAKTAVAEEVKAMIQAYANSAVYNPKSTVATVKAGLELDKNEYGKATITLKNAQDGFVADDVYVWAEAAANEISAAFVAYGDNVSYVAPGVYKVAVSSSETFNIAFTTAGTYNLKAATVTPVGADLAKLAKLTAPAGFNTVKVNSAAVDTKLFNMSVVADETTVDANVANGEETDKTIVVVADGVSTVDVVAGFTYYGNVMPGQEVSISTNSSSVEVDTEKAYTNFRGEVEFAISGTIEGEYLVTLKTGNFSADIKVVVVSTAAADIELIEEPTAPIALDIATSDFRGEVEFEITDVNGNLVTTKAGVANAAAANPNADQAKYVSFIEKPEGSKLADKNIWIESDGEHWDLVINKAFDKEGTYSVKVVLDNGRTAVATWEVKEFQTPVEIVIDAPATVELGTDFVVDMDYVDVNGVTKPVDNKTTLAATGYAIKSFNNNALTVKTDEKYAGSVITLTAVSEKYDLVAVKEVKVAAEAVAIAFEDATVETNVNNKIEWNVVDAEGNAVELTNVAATVIKYVVLDKPADAKVSVVDRTGANFDGDGEMSLTSNKVGNVAVQVIAQVKFGAAGNDLGAVQTKYYTGTQIFAVGNGQVGDVVVMSIGSNEIVINDAKAAIDAAPIVENNRTFVPFRALAEAFGATVAYDEATQAVTAELNGVTVVMTIGSAEYTVNGVAKTADVAPFINGSRTMVPVRFAAEAFGIKVIPTYDENGATADILFNL